MKKSILLTFLIFGISNIGICQQRIVEKHFPVNKNEKVTLHLKFGNSITVKSWPKNEVAFKAKIEINQGKLNDALVLHFKHQNNRLLITSDYNHEKLDAWNVSDCNGNDNSKFSISDNGKSQTLCTDITYKVLVPSNVKLKVTSTDSDIILVDLGGPIRAKSTFGFVDLNWRPEKPARFMLKTTFGEIYTNLDDLKITHKNHNSIAGQNIKATLGQDGPTVSLESVSGNIYLRKAG